MNDPFRIVRVLAGIFILGPMILGVIIMIKLLDVKEWACAKKN
ncbi:MAG TPA: hypothetical protein PKO44_08295 [Candidatus Omnitrophota bacterium]|nr:hypothetical protein [Candidatus Omnitrophota bacterium]